MATIARHLSYGVKLFVFLTFLRVQEKRPTNRKFVLINGHPGRVSSVDRPLFWALKRREDLSDLSSLARDRSFAARLLVLLIWELKKMRMTWKGENDMAGQKFL